MLKKIIAGGIDDVEVVLTDAAGREWLSRNGFTDLRTPDSRGKTPMYWACESGHLKVAEWLILKGALNTPKKTGTGAADAKHCAKLEEGVTSINLWALCSYALSLFGCDSDPSKEVEVYSPLNTADFDEGEATNDSGDVDPSLVKALGGLKRGRVLYRLLFWAIHLREHFFLKVVLMGTLKRQGDSENGSANLWKLPTITVRLIARFLGFKRNDTIIYQRQGEFTRTSLRMHGKPPGFDFGLSDKDFRKAAELADLILKAKADIADERRAGTGTDYGCTIS